MKTGDIPGYHLQRLLGRGGTAAVYLAVRDRDGCELALKLMSPTLAQEADRRERFLREARLGADMVHPHIVAIHEVGLAQGLPYIAMTYYPDGDLRTRLKQGVSLQEALRITRDVAQALEYAHGRGCRHRDIKPDNILLREGRAVLADFGMATVAGGAGKDVMDGGGSPQYMSPEQARGQSLDDTTDFYSLGVVLYEMLSGRLPYVATDPVALAILHMNAPIPQLQGRAAHFQPLLDRLLAKQPALRPQNAAQVLREIGALETAFDFASGTALEVDHERTLIRPAARKKITAASAPQAAEPVLLRAPESAHARRRPQWLRRSVFAVAAVVLLMLATAIAWWQGASAGKVMTVAALPAQAMPPVRATSAAAPGGSSSPVRLSLPMRKQQDRPQTGRQQQAAQQRQPSRPTGRKSAEYGPAEIGQQQ